MGNANELMRLCKYKERKELVLKRYRELNGDLVELEKWYKKAYGDDSLTTVILAERQELIIEHYKSSGSNKAEMIKWYGDTFKDDIDIGDAEVIVVDCTLSTLANNNVPPLQNAPEQSIVDEVAKHNLAPSEVMANYMPSKEKSKGCMITILIMITATSLTSLLFL